MNQIRVKVHPHTVQVNFSVRWFSNSQGYFAVYVEVFSLLSFNEMKTFVNIASPEPEQALLQLKGSDIFQQERFNKAQISLRCGGKDHPMTFPVYGKNCTHIDVFPLFIKHSNCTATWVILLRAADFGRTGIWVDLSTLRSTIWRGCSARGR